MRHVTLIDKVEAGANDFTKVSARGQLCHSRLKSAEARAHDASFLCAQDLTGVIAPYRHHDADVVRAKSVEVNRRALQLDSHERQ